MLPVSPEARASNTPDIGGSVTATRAEDLAFFDALPADVRRALIESTNDFSGPAIFDAYMQYGAFKTIGLIKANDKMLTREVLREAYGPDHPGLKPAALTKR